MKTSISETVQAYSALHDAELEERRSRYAQVVTQYFDLVTAFYEFGWGQSFHFAPLKKNEPLRASILRYEHLVARSLNCRAGMLLADIGCGVGGPMRTFSRDFEFRVDGINIHEGQIRRGRQLNREAGLEDRCAFVRADFLRLPLRENSYDGAYAFESTPHSPDRRAMFEEVFRILKPGGRFVGHDWCLTAKFDGASPVHQRIKKEIEVGTGLPDLPRIPVVLDAMCAAGFELLEHGDLAAGSTDVPWYTPLAANWSLTGIPRSRAGRWLTHGTLQLLESIRIVPRGTAAVSEMLNSGADALVRGGETGVFTPVYFFNARKPVSERP